MEKPKAFIKDKYKGGNIGGGSYIPKMEPVKPYKPRRHDYLFISNKKSEVEESEEYLESDDEIIDEDEEIEEEEEE